MIIKSMSRKEASFGQLMDYIDRDGGEERSRIRYNLISRDRERIRAEFEQNAEHMQSRKNGVFMYHEIISITRARGVDLETQKERLHQIAQEYVAARAPRNLCYGGLHDDKDHSLHYHLMISANRAGEAKRHRLSKEQFRTIQISLERYVLETYPELEQKVAIDKTAEARVTRKEAELKRRTGEVPERVKLGDRVREVASNARDRESLLRELEASGLELYIRGQNIGIIDRESGKRHRVKTLDAELPALLHSKMTTTLEKPEKRQETPQEKRRPADEKEKEQKARDTAESETSKGDPRRQGDSDMTKNRRGEELIEPSVERQEMIDKGHIKPDAARDKMTHEAWREQETFTNKVKQSARRTMDDFEGRSEKLEKKAKEAPEQQRWREEMEARRTSERQQDRERDDDLER